MNTIGEKILKLRESRGLTQEELSAEINVSRQTISNWELDITSPSVKYIKKLCLVFKIDANYFISDIDIEETAKSENAVSVANDDENSSRKAKPLKIAVIIFGCLLTAMLLFTLVLTLLLKLNTEDYPESTTSVTVSISFEFFICVSIIAAIAITFIVLLTLYLIKTKNSSKK